MQKNYFTKCNRLLFFFLFTTLVTRISALTDGYILTGAYGGNTTVLLDKSGEKVKEWQHTSLNGYSCYILPNGNLLRTCQVNTPKTPPNAAPKQGGIEEIDSIGKVVWTYTLCNDTLMLHHDMKPLPNGNILATTFSLITKSEMIEFGIDTMLLTVGSKSLLAEKIIEIKPKYPSGGDIVWEWRIYDHLVKKADAATHPELISGHIVPALWQGQWVHLNGIDYSPKTDLIVFSSRIFSELFVIDHSTTTQEAAGHTAGKYKKGGDILYRWGKPANYGASGATTIECLHSTTWIPEGYAGAGNILFFHNNTSAVKSESVEIKPPLDSDGNFILESGKAYGPATPTWKYAPASGMYSQFMSSTIRMPNGNTVVHETFPMSQKVAEGTIPQTNSRIREVDPSGQIVWMDTLTVKASAGFNPAKMMYYPSSNAGVRKLLTLPFVHTIKNQGFTGSSLPGFRVHQAAGSIVFSGVCGYEIKVFNMQGKEIFSAFPTGNKVDLKTGSIPAGLYYAKIMNDRGMKAFGAITITK